MRDSVFTLLVMAMLCAGWGAGGCSQTAPDEGMAQSAIRDHFENRGFRVMEIRIQEIQRNPLPERDYMAPLTFVIEVSKIRLESMEDKGESLRFRKGESVTFRDARVRIRRGNAPGRPWEIAHISGIDVP